MKKFIISITILPFISFVGCGFTTETIKPNDYNKYEEENGQPSGINVLSNDSIKYYFVAKEYSLDNDTLFGKGVQITNESEIPFDGNIPINKIKSITVEEPDRSYIVIGFMTIVIPITVLLYWAITWNDN